MAIVTMTFDDSMYRLVPLEPTKEMCRAAVVYANGNAVYKNLPAAVLDIEEGIYGEAYKAMLYASPQPPTGTEKRANVYMCDETGTHCSRCTTACEAKKPSGAEKK